MSRTPLALAALIVTSAAIPVRAESVTIDLPAGTVGQQVVLLGRLAKVSIGVPDAALWARRVPAVRRQPNARAALVTIARNAGARVDQVGPAAFRLSPLPAPVVPRARTLPRPAPIHTEPAPSPSPPDIVVIASKRDTTRDHFPGQFTSISGAALELGGAGGTERVEARVASFASTHLGPGRNKLFIRGIADSSFAGASQATVGQYLGDLRISYNAPDPDLRLIDLKSVEVLEGPQGTLYGAGSLGGIVRYVPQPPDLGRISGSVAAGTSATTHGKPGVDAQAVINLPIVTDRLAVRAAFVTSDEGGWIDKPLLDRSDVNRTKIAGGRLSTRLALGGGWTLDMIGMRQRILGDDSQYADRGGAPLVSLAPVAEGFRAGYTQGQVVIEGHVGDVQLRSSTGVTRQNLLERYDATPPGSDPRLFEQRNRTHMIANETRAWRSHADGTGWLIGASYIDNRSTLTRQIGPVGSLAPVPGVTNGIREMTVYGEATVRSLSTLLLTGGLRVTRSTLDGSVEDGPVGAVVASGSILSQRVAMQVLPSASALVELSPKTQAYIRFQKGFRPGGLAIAGDFVRRFNDDHTATIEAGVREGRAGVDRFDLTVTGAHTAWDNIQADYIDASGLPSTVNVGNGHVWTLGVTAGVMPRAGWRLEAGVALNRSRIDDVSFPLQDAGGVLGDAIIRFRQIPNIAPVTARIASHLDTTVGNADLTIDGWARYVGPSRLGVGPVLGERQGNYVDSGVTGRLALGGFGITLSVTNLLDVRGNRFALGTPFVTGREQITPLRPRTIRLGFDKKF